VCLSVCPRGYLENHTRDLYQIFFVHVAYVRGSVLLRHVDDRPHCVSPGRGFLPHLKCIIGRERGWECTARAKYAIYDCLVKTKLIPITKIFVRVFAHAVKVNHDSLVGMGVRTQTLSNVTTVLCAKTDACIVNMSSAVITMFISISLAKVYQILIYRHFWNQKL